MSTLLYRELYAPAHFGNFYEIAADYEIEEILKEAVFWGFNAYGDWFDAADMKNPLDNPRNEYLSPQAIWERKKNSYRIASELGLETSWLVTPNHVFTDQLTADNAAEVLGDERFFGQLVCPSNPAARQTILDTQLALLQDLKSAGGQVDYIGGCPFDYGGCSCERCTPWIITWGKLMADIHETAKQVFPDIRMRLTGWWWTSEEHKLFKTWADNEQPGRFISLAEHIIYDQTHPTPGIVLPDKCEAYAFIHIGYNNKQIKRDVYGIWGPLIAPERIEKTIKDLTAGGFTGYSAYSEGTSDDVNKALLAGLSSGKFTNPHNVLTAYAQRYFETTDKESRDWADWLSKWADPYAVDLPKARKEFEALAKCVKRPGWRLDQWECRLRLFEANSTITAQKEWNETANAAAKRFILERDRMYREVWKLGLVRHVLNFHFSQPEWFDNYKSRNASFHQTSEM